MLCTDKHARRADVAEALGSRNSSENVHLCKMLPIGDLHVADVSRVLYGAAVDG
jgi:hypothetical protein